MVGVIKGNLKEAAKYGSRKGVVIVYVSPDEADYARRIRDYLVGKNFSVTVRVGEQRIFEMDPRWWIFVGKGTNINVQKFSLAFRLIGYPHIWIVGDKICILPRPESRRVHCNPSDFMIVSHPFMLPRGMSYITVIYGIEEMGLANATYKFIEIMEREIPWGLILLITAGVLGAIAIREAIKKRAAAK